MHNSIKSEIDQFLGDLSLLSEDRINVLIEDKEDQLFWKLIFESRSLKPIFPKFPSKSDGKPPLLQDYSIHLSEKLVICVDSDNDHLHETSFSPLIQQRPKYLYHTYTHSRENHLIYPDNLALEYESITFEILDFATIFQNISEVLYPWLVTWLFFNDKSKEWVQNEITDFKSFFSWKKLESVVEEAFKELDKKDNVNDILSVLSDLNSLISTTLKDIWDCIPDAYGFLRDEFKDYSENPIVGHHETLFFIQGHCAFEAIVLPLFNHFVRVESSKKARNEKEINKKNHWINKAKENYKRDLSRSFQTCLVVGRSCKFIQQIQNDISHDFAKTS